MSLISSVFRGPNVLSAVIGATFSAGAFFYTVSEDNVAKAVAETVAITALEGKLDAQQRQLDNALSRQDRNIVEIKSEQSNLRRQALTEGTERNKVTMEVLEERLKALASRIEDLPKVAGGGVDPVALSRAVAEAKQELASELDLRFSKASISQGNGLTLAQVETKIRGIKNEILSELDMLLDKRVASLPAAQGDGIPIATKRRIHFVEKGCVHLPSFEKQFTLKFRRGDEFCWKPSILWFDITESNWNSFQYRYVGGTSNSCSLGRTCYIGSEEDGTRYRVRIENTYEKEGIRYQEVNFLKID